MSEQEQMDAQPKRAQEPNDTDNVMKTVTHGGRAEGSKPSPKKIIVCCDGTGNEFIGRDSKDKDDSNSNVVRFYTALKLDNEQFAYYHPGVGTMGDPTKRGVARLWSVVKGLAFGAGFKDNVLDAYRYLMQHYNSGDTVYIIGFSRGAYTARALAGLLHGYGLLCRGNEGHLLYAWRMYTAKVAEMRAQNKHRFDTDFSFRDTFSHKDFMMHFVGLWDTVSSVGWISEPLRLMHTAQNPSIATIRHVVSTNERRCFYQDNLYGDPVAVQVPEALKQNEQRMKNIPALQRVPPVQDLVQVWFPGVHSDVGGSYSQATSGLSTESLEWMLEQGEAAGLVFDPVRRKIVLGQQLTSDDLKEPGAADLAALYPAATSSDIHVSLKGAWWALEIFPHRYYTSDNGPEKMRIPLGAWRRIPKGSIVDARVRAQFKNTKYEHAFVQPVVPPGPTEADLSKFSQTTVELREAGLRESSFVVFLVSLVEIAVGLLAGWGLLLVLLHLLSGLRQGLLWFGREILPADDWPCTCGTAAACVRGWWAAHVSWLDKWFVWPLVFAFVILVVRLVVQRIGKKKEDTESSK